MMLTPRSEYLTNGYLQFCYFNIYGHLQVDSWHGPFSILLLQVVFILEYIVNSSSGSSG
jgi:hypothetical protein